MEVPCMFKKELKVSMCRLLIKKSKTLTKQSST